ncbi:MAG: NADH:ubiquinone oxidoreductase [Synergistaceae bacterium]|jgi:multicomponent Na+:H+ antiporter subunit D|nr:NADH:ubiquinone oxidoreductase [Synergistaceae bacterium]
MSWQVHLPALLIAVPLLGAFLAPLTALGGKGLRNTWFVLVSLAFTLIAFLLWARVGAFGTAVYVMGGQSWNLALPSGMEVPVRILMEVDAFSAFMVLLSAVAALAGAIFSVTYMDRFSGLEKFVALYFLMVAGMFGMEITGDFFNFFVFLEISSVASFGLVAFWRDRGEALEAAFKYMLVSTLGALMVLVAVAFLYSKYNVVNMAALGKVIEWGMVEKTSLVLFLTALAMKCGAVPMHMWMPDAYAEAPAGVTCALIAVSQASLYGLFRVTYTIFGAFMGSPIIPWVIIVLGVLSMFIGVSMAVIQKEVGRLIAYHSVSQVGYMLLGFGVGLLALSDARAMADYGFTALKGGVYHIVNYTMYKGLLFLSAGALFYATGCRNLNDMGGLGRKMPKTMGLFMIAAAAIAGLPPFNGFVSKLFLYESSFAVHPVLAVFAMVTSVLTLASFVKIFQTAFLGPALKKFDNVREVPGAMLLGMSVLGVAILLLSLFPTWSVNHLVEPAAKALVDQASYIGAVFAATVPGGGL